MIPDYLVANGFIGVKRCRRGIFMFNRNDRFVGRSLDLYGEWCDSEIVLLEKFLRPGDTVVDAGANIGTHTIAFAALVGEAGAVIAFEPQRFSFQLLCGNAALNCLTNVECRRQGLGESIRKAGIPRLSPRETWNFAAVAIGGDHEADEVEIVTLDSLGLKSCRLIKIDVEGMEPEVIRGARATIEAHRPVLFVECNTRDGAARTIGAIRDAGYRAWWHLGLYYNERNFFGNPENVFARYQPEANLLCLPDGADPGVPELIECTGVDDDWQQAVRRGIAARNPLFFPQSEGKAVR